MPLNLRRISTAGFPGFPGANIYVHWPNAAVELVFNTNTSLNLGTQQQWLIPLVVGAAPGNNNAIEIRLEATGETYYIYDTNAAVPAPMSKLSTAHAGIAIPIGPGANQNALELVLTYQHGSPAVGYSLR
ncbi:MAG: hypothetical protein AB1489_20000 [Acidobacteriota bacterium]